MDRINLSMLEEVNRFVCFFPSLISQEDVDNFSNLLLNNSIIPKLQKKTIYILCLFTSTDTIDLLLKKINDNQLVCKFTTLYYSNELKKYASFLKKGSRNEKVKNEDFLLSNENYCDYFKSMVRRYFN